jgi:DNA mismatch repair protein MutL
MSNVPSMPSGPSATRTQSFPSFLRDTSASQTPPQETLLPTPAAAVREVLQVDNTWLILAEDDALVIVDQHALHERVMFEEIRARIGRGDLMSQRLLVPAVADVPPGALAHAIINK